MDNLTAHHGTMTSNLSFLPESCIIDSDSDYIAGQLTDSIFKWQGLTRQACDCAVPNNLTSPNCKPNQTQQACADLTASTTNGRYWSYMQSEMSCWVKKTKSLKRRRVGFVSGNGDCGVRGLRGEKINNRYEKFYKFNFKNDCPGDDGMVRVFLL